MAGVRGEASLTCCFFSSKVYKGSREEVCLRKAGSREGSEGQTSSVQQAGVSQRQSHPFL